jgi:CheY-like chemotaxis protein
MFLAPLGPLIIEGENGQEALDLLARQAFDLVLLDVHMPVMDGIEATRQIRGSGQPWANLPIVALTADAMSGDRERFLRLGMSGYTSKPINQVDLFSEISRVMTASILPIVQNAGMHLLRVDQPRATSVELDLADILAGIDRAVA